MTPTVSGLLLALGWVPMLVGMARRRRQARAPALRAAASGVAASVSAVAAGATAGRTTTAAPTTADRVLLATTWVLCLALTAAAVLDVQRANAPGRAVIGVAVFLASMIVWLWARTAQGNDFAQITRAPAALVTSGPYRFVRHPLYLATAVGTTGHVVAAGTLRAASLWVVLVLVLAVRSVREERLLRATFGPIWDAYARRSLGLLRAGAEARSSSPPPGGPSESTHRRPPRG